MDYWQKQSAESPLYPDIAWDKPERKDLAGRLLIIGGNVHGFAAPAKAFEYANAAGVGYCKILLPDALKSALHAYWTDAVFCPSTSSGSFSQKSREIVLNSALWADGIILAGDLGRNSETAMMLDDMVRSIKSPLCITRDALDYYIARPVPLLERPNTLLVGSLAQIQKIIESAGNNEALTYTMPLASMVGTLSRFTTRHACAIITKSDNHIISALEGKVITTKLSTDKDIWRLETATNAAVSWLHNPGKQLESMAHAALI
jgi:ADP-dependent NAD(P)H-hydrate dehydratase / NAD(P)H-hydrate epimerase